MSYNKSLYPFESKWMNIQNHKIHYVDEGQGQVILFSHAPLGSSFMYRRFIQVLSKQFRCIALDYPGFGLSSDDPNQVYSIVTQSDLLRDFILNLNITSVIGLGHDTGGPSLFKVAVEHPKWFKGLILTDTIIFPTIEYKKIHRMLRVVGSSFFQNLNNTTNLLVKLTFSKGVPTRKLLKEEKAQYAELFNTRQKRNRVTQILTSLRRESDFMAKVKNGFQNELQNKPTLLMYGEADPVNQLGIPQRIQAMLKNSELFLIHREGHFPHEGQPNRMSEIISHWVHKL